MRWFTLACSICLSLAALPAIAGSGKTTELEALEKTLYSAREKEQAIARQQKALEAQLKETQESLVRTAAEEQAVSEQKLALDRELEALKESEQAALKQLEARQRLLSEMLIALMRLREIPPAAMLARPGDIESLANTASMLGTIRHSLEEQAEAVRKELAAIRRLQEDIAKQEEAVAAKAAELVALRETLEKEVKARSSLYEEMDTDYARLKKENEALAKRVHSLRELVQELSPQWLIPSSKPQIAAAPSPARPRMAENFESLKGRLRQPVAGRMLSDAVENLPEALRKGGITLETANAAGVVAPATGEVVYAGNFLDVGKLVILRHSSDYHTLLAGLTEIRAFPGQWVLEGEPIGVMGNEDDGRNRLYMELRKKNQPVNPTGWIAWSHAKTGNM